MVRDASRRSIRSGHIHRKDVTQTVPGLAQPTQRSTARSESASTTNDPASLGCHLAQGRLASSDLRRCAHHGHVSRDLARERRALHCRKLPKWSPVSCIVVHLKYPNSANKFERYLRFHQDNNPKHSAKLSQEFLESTGINWVKSPPRSHDLNPIELVWTDLIQNVSKRLPKTIGQVVVAVKDYWKTLTPEKCSEFIDKLVDIVPKVLDRTGEWVSMS